MSRWYLSAVLRKPPRWQKSFPKLSFRPNESGRETARTRRCSPCSDRSFVERSGLEPPTPCLQSRCSTN
jgi:hypothetical protein